MAKAYLQIVLKGMVMGAADIVPGVSGGTMAFIMGIYERLITAISRINVQAWRIWRSQGGRAAWRYMDGGFLLALFIGILLSVVSLSHVIKGLLLHYPLHLWGFFFGLVAASVWALGREVGRFDVQIFAFAGLGALGRLVDYDLHGRSRCWARVWVFVYCGRLGGLRDDFARDFRGIYFVVNWRL
ncbi:DUF368 domain-containing protein [Rappaport israeli]|uniref:DUF368 domain-containing protein n=1 Tax=Rappaport israeli TaxID=1839807 RepID=UPI000B195E34